jgi:hypothetical protein
MPNGQNDGSGSRKGGFFDLSVTTAILSLVSLMISVGVAVRQGYDEAIGPNIGMFPSNQIVLAFSGKSDEYPRDQHDLLISVPLSYVNNAAAGINGLIRDEKLELKIGSDAYDFDSWEIVRSHLAKQGDFTFEPKEDAGPFLVTGRDSVTHETLFEPARCDDGDMPCLKKDLSWSNFYGKLTEFRDHIPPGKPDASLNLNITLTATEFKGKIHTAYCVVSIRASDVSYLDPDHQGYLAPVCIFEDEADNSSFFDKWLGWNR